MSLEQRRGEILAVIGPNGAGKTSLFNCLTGVYRPQEGSIRFHARRRTARCRPRRQAAPPHQPHRRRADVPDDARMFNALTTFENVKIGVEARSEDRPDRRDAAPAARRAARNASPTTAALELLEFVGLTPPANDLAELPALRRPAASRDRAGARARIPKCCCSTSPPRAPTRPRRSRCRADPQDQHELGVSVLLIEHDMRLVMSIAQRIYVLNFGQVIAEGTARRDPAEPRRHRGLPRHLGTDRLTTAPAARRSSSEPPARGPRRRGPLRQRAGGPRRSRWTSKRARSSPCSAPTARASPRRCGCSRGCTDRPRAPSRFRRRRGSSRCRPHKIVRLGLGHVPEGRRIFPTMTVVENLEMGAFQRHGSLAGRTSSTSSSSSRSSSERRKQLGGTLSGGEQQMLAIGRALMAEPTLLLLRRAVARPRSADRRADLHHHRRRSATRARRSCSSSRTRTRRCGSRTAATCWRPGRITIEDRAAALLGDRRIREAYLGETAG